MSESQPVRRRSLLKGVAATGLGGALALAAGRPARASAATARPAPALPPAGTASRSWQYSMAFSSREP
jgi:hypothetical protein